MKILFSSHFFAPSIGGIQEVGGILAHEFTLRGHEVIVVTQTLGDGEFPFEVIRAPSLATLARLTRWSDLVFHNNISLRTAWPLALIRRPWVVAHHSWIARVDGRRAMVDRLKLRAIRTAKNVAVSRALAAGLGVEARVIPNPYRDDLFRTTNNGERRGDLVFLGRLVSHKGADLFIEALGLMNGFAPRATIAGDGPERAALEAHARRLGLEVTFTGAMRGEALVRLLNEHRLIVAPSLLEEPFGLAALEGMACGCVPLVARAGGLPEAVGEAGVMFTKGDASELAGSMKSLLADEGRLAELRSRAAGHLERHRAEVIAGEYLEVMEEALR